MKKWSRLTALMLAFVIMFSTVSGALAAVEVDYEALMQWIQSVKDAHGLGGVIKLDRGGEVLFEPVPFEPTTVGPQYTQKGTVALSAYSEEDEIPVLVAKLERHGKIDLVAPAAGQWKVFVPAANAWINVNGETGSTFAVTMAKLQSMFADNDTVVLCCKLSETQMTEFVAVTVSDTVTELTAAVNEEPANTKMKAVVPQTAAYSNDGGMAAADEPVLGKYTVTIQYLFGDNTTAATPYSASVAAGSALTPTIVLPVVTGYEPSKASIPEGVEYIEATETSAASIKLSLTNISENVDYKIYYVPADVNYTVIHYKQNTNDDDYTEAKRETFTGKTNDYVPEVAKIYVKDEETVVVDNDYIGFYSLVYVKPQIAADGSTVVEVYYDRNYYLMLFELDGGYGTEPVYGRYGAPVSVTNPEKTGYTFGGWSPAVPDNIPLGGGTYTAQWTDAQTVDYSVVYWREKADSEEFEFWGSEIKQAVAGSTVSGSDSVPTSISNATIDGATVNEKPYFTYNAGRTDKNVVIEGNGSSVVNVYYNRNSYTILFKGYGKCALENHEHNAECRTLKCYLEEHTHGTDCIPSYSCGQVEHTAHTDECLICNEPDHTHTAICYISRSWGRNSECDFGQHPNNAANGTTHSHDWYGTTYTCVRYNNNWYYYDMDNPVNTNTCNAHEHSASCYKDALHTHTDNCITYSCGKVNHSHTAGCYQDCSKTVHTHTNTCNTNNTNNVIYVITAKYNQTIGNIWPTYDVLKAGTHAYENSNGNVVNNDGDIFRGWGGLVTNQETVSKRINMTTDLCDTSDGVKEATARYGATYTYHLYYMFESFDQTSAAEGNERKQHTNNRVTKYYDSDPVYYQELVYSSDTTFSQKEILGMNPVGTEKTTTGSGNSYVIYNWLYYDRVRSDLSFQNVSKVEKTVPNIMYGQPLADYTDSNGKKLSEYGLTDDQYPVADLVGLYRFDGWYTTPECYEGTEFNFATATMPLTDLTLYAHWVPINHRVRIYLTEVDADNENETNQIGDTLDAPHGYRLNEEDRPATPTNGGLTFVGWFYKTEEGEEKAFDFNNMAVTRDMDVYAKWSSNIIKQYYVYYKLGSEDGPEVAAVYTDSTLVGETLTFDAKGGKELYPAYQEGFFPTTPSHSMEIKANEDNVYTFIYVESAAVPYTVKYLEAGTNAELLETKVVSDNRKAVVTENFEVIKGYMPDAYQKRLVVSAEAGAVNEIIFYYTADTTHAYYKISHYIEPLQEVDYVKWEEYASTEAVGDITATYTATPITINGFEYDPTIADNVVSGVLTEDGLHLKLYYRRSLYPYKIRYREQGTNKDLVAEKNLEGKFGWTYIANASDVANDPALANYELVSNPSQSLEISRENPASVLNVITFYYKEKEVAINYVPVFDRDNDGDYDVMSESERQTIGDVDRDTESLPIISGGALGSTASLAVPSSSTYKFEGWYSDPECKPEDLVSTDPRYVPTREEGALWEAATYYAKFDYNLTTLTIKKSCHQDIDDGQSFLFKVEGYGLPEGGLLIAINGDGSETISGLTVGQSYTVTEVENWSWRYTAEPKSITLTSTPSENKVEMVNTRDQIYWLSGDCYEENVFGEPSGN